ncbi:DnaJ protein subfamily B 2 [Paragonimus heterotremus]|uniref:DnaJ protein subfamily B 2 n=1 Tax=Paragonimus heterotremus TaxID=100268 RepID=A0A8J4T7Q4_9TREM|nr:DnaJ protein subfamily B 2 [Paragonimus heterotremus]
MDANKDEAVRCISMAKARLASGQREAARKYVIKAMRLYPSISINERKTSNLHSAEPKPASQKESENHSTTTFTKAQAEAVRKVLVCKDYYELLGVSKESSEDEIRRAYKLLALKFHPDKNRAPGATEAFKKIGNALSVLTDTEKRRRYDQFGTEEEQAPRITPVYRHVDPFFQPDADVFSMFFNGGFPFAQVYRGQHHRPARSRESERENNYFIYIQLVPLILIFALSFFSNLFVKDPYYSLTSTDPYSVERFTNSHRVPFYVKPSFEKDFDGNLARLESQIEGEFENNLRIRCFREKEYRERMLFQARHFGDDADFQRAQRIQLRSCERLIEVFGG